MTGVQRFTVAEEEADLRLDRWFKRHFPYLVHSRLEKLLRKGQIRVNGRRAKSNQRLEPGQELRIPPLPDTDANERPKPSRTYKPDQHLIKELTEAILYEDEDLLVLNKPAGVAVQGGSGVSKHIDGALDALKQGAKERPRLVHRLDKDTAGVLLLARSAKSAADLAERFRHREIEKLYWAVVVGQPGVSDGSLEGAVTKASVKSSERMELAPEQGKTAITDFKVISSAGGRVSWLELRPRTGRTHQLRVHCMAMGTPIVGDGKYGGRTAFLSDLPGAKSLHLFAKALHVPRQTKKDIIVSAPLPQHMKTTFDYLGFEESEAEQILVPKR